MYASPVSDPLTDRISITQLPLPNQTAAAGPTNQTAKDLIASNAPNPGSLAVILTGLFWTAAHTLDVKLQGSNDGFTTPVDLVTFTQLTNANVGTPQRANIPKAYKSYRLVTTSVGAFSSVTLVASCVLVGTNFRATPPFGSTAPTQV